MSKQRITLDLNELVSKIQVSLPNYSLNEYKKRLLIIAFYEIVSHITEINAENIKTLTHTVKAIINDPYYNTDNLISWMLQDENRPSKYERFILFNQTKAPTSWLRKHLKIASSNIYKWPGKPTVKINIPATTDLIAIAKSLVNYDFIILDLSFIRGILWN